jgi:hypothetical protein
VFHIIHPPQSFTKFTSFSAQVRIIIRSKKTNLQYGKEHLQAQAKK